MPFVMMKGFGDKARIGAEIAQDFVGDAPVMLPLCSKLLDDCVFSFSRRRIVDILSEKIGSLADIFHLGGIQSV